MTTETQDETRDRVRGYIQYNATKGDADVLGIVEQGHADLIKEIDGLSEAQATFVSPSEGWSVLDTMQHVVAAKKGTARLCVSLGQGTVPAGVGGEGEELKKQDGVKGRAYESLAEARAAAVQAHEELVAFVRGMSGETDTETQHTHFIFGDLNCREWAVFQRVHDADHAQQFAKIKASEGFPNS